MAAGIAYLPIMPVTRSRAPFPGIVLLAVVVFVQGGCAADAEDTSADDADIRAGTLANGDQREVGLFFFPLQGGGQGRCTATLIGPRTAITAAHCVLPTSGAGACSGGSIYLDSKGTGGAFTTRVNVKVRACATPIGDVRSLSVRAQDIAVLALDRKVTEVPQQATIASAAPLASAKVSVYGYGRIGASCTDINGDQKYRAVTTFGSTVSPTCKGDSGGPYFVGEGRTLTHQIVSLTSGETTNAGLRVVADLVANKAWIDARRTESEAGRALTDAR